MILVDTSIWVDHLRKADHRLVELLHETRVLMHPWIVGELALGGVTRRNELLHLLLALPHVDIVTPPETLLFLSAHGLDGFGIGYVDLQLLAATVVTPGTRLWTRDKRLAAAADHVAVGA